MSTKSFDFAFKVTEKVIEDLQSSQEEIRSYARRILKLSGAVNSGTTNNDNDLSVRPLGELTGTGAGTAVDPKRLMSYGK